MKKTVKYSIDDKDITIEIRRIKKKELKPLTAKLAEKIDIGLSLGNADNSQNLIDFLNESIDFICEEIVIPFTNLESEQLDEMDATDIVSLLNDMITHNGISAEKVQRFFTKNVASAKNPRRKFEGIPVQP